MYSPSDCPCRGVSYHSAKILRRSIAAAPQPGGRLGSLYNVFVCVCHAEWLFGHTNGAGRDACGCRRYGDAKTDKERYELRSDVIEVRACLLPCFNAFTTCNALLAACCMRCFAVFSQLPSHLSPSPRLLKFFIGPIDACVCPLTSRFFALSVPMPASRLLVACGMLL